MNRIDSWAGKLESIFEQFDEDSSGYLDRTEIVELLNDIADDMGLSA
jgi:Ca2+-binding EF-hand superfamily protein